jgi:dienelactone hydrolase
MKRFLIITILTCFLFDFTGCKKDVKEALDNGLVVSQENELQNLSEKLAVQMAQGSFDETYQECSMSVKLQMSKNALKQAWNSTVDGMGEYVSVYEITQEKVDKYQKVYVILQYENNGLKISFTFTDDGKIDGLWLNYSPIEEKAVSTDTYEETKITFGEGDYPVTGILTLPKNVENPPVVILVPGSGNHDVNETVGANKPFRDIAWGLAEQGIASIRYNERVFLYPELAQTDFTIGTDSLNDASDAISYALSCDQIDPEHIFIIGHSLGGMMAPKIAYDHSEVAGIVLLAGSPRKLEDIIYDQVTDAIDHTAGVTDAQAKEALATTEKGMKAVQNLTEGSNKVILGYPATYWYSLNQIDIAAISKELTIPVYIAQGSADWQVFPDKDFTKWQELLGDKKNVTFKLYDNLNHLFMTSNGKTDITEYNIAGSVDQTVLDDIAAWIKGQE